MFLLAFILPGLALVAIVMFLVLRMVAWLFWLPFRLVGLALSGIALVLLLPVLLLVGLTVMGTFALLTIGVVALPLAGLALILGGVWWLVRALARPHASASG